MKRYSLILLTGVLAFGGGDSAWAQTVGGILDNCFSRFYHRMNGDTENGETYKCLLGFNKSKSPRFYDTIAAVCRVGANAEDRIKCYRNGLQFLKDKNPSDAAKDAKFEGKLIDIMASKTPEPSSAGTTFVETRYDLGLKQLKEHFPDYFSSSREKACSPDMEIREPYATIYGDLRFSGGGYLEDHPDLIDNRGQKCVSMVEYPCVQLKLSHCRNIDPHDTKDGRTPNSVPSVLIKNFASADQYLEDDADLEKEIAKQDAKEAAAARRKTEPNTKAADGSQ